MPARLLSFPAYLFKLFIIRALLQFVGFDEGAGLLLHMRVELVYHGDGIMENLADIFRVFRVARLEVVFH